MLEVCARSANTLRSLLIAVLRLWSNTTWVSGQSFSQSVFRLTTCPALSISGSRIWKGFSFNWMRIPCLRSSRDRTTVGKFFTSFMGSARRGSWPRPQVARRSFLSLLSFCSNSLFPKALDADKHLSLCLDLFPPTFRHLSPESFSDARRTAVRRRSTAGIWTTDLAGLKFKTQVEERTDR